MPELPEVEVTRLGISDKLVGARIADVAIHSAKFRAMLPTDIARILTGQTIQSVVRRGKYLILTSPAGSLLLHLGMTGHLRLVSGGSDPGAHDHFDLRLDSGLMLRMNDVRRFGSLCWTPHDPLQHKLLKAIGPEPLTGSLTGEYLFRKSRGKKLALQRFLMDGAVVAGIGNIYAAESLFRCRILPDTPAGALSLSDSSRLSEAIKETLSSSIAAGRSAMDFTVAEEKLAYFPQRLYVYGREGKPCLECGGAIRRGRLGNRSTFFCPACQL